MDAGLDTDQVAGLLFRLAFGSVVAGGAGPDPAELVADQSEGVRAAWSETIGRMVVLDLLRAG